MDPVVLLALLAGLAAGALAAWVVARSQFRRELAESISTHQATVGAAQALFHQTTRRLSEVQTELTRTRDDLDRARAEGAASREALARANTELGHQREAVAQQLALLSQAQEQLKDSFQALAGAALKSSNDEFLKLAHERLAAVEQSAVTALSKKQQ